MKLINCDESYSEQILAILNDAIVTSTALYDYQPRTMESMTAWFAAKKKGNYPVLGLVDESDELLSFASYGSFRAWPAYKYSVEHSVYVAAAHRGKGLGKRLLQAIVESARQQEYHAVIGAIDSDNATSIGLHESLGFKRSGMLHQVGFKFGRWLDLVFVQLILNTPANPIDG